MKAWARQLSMYPPGRCQLGKLQLPPGSSVREHRRSVRCNNHCAGAVLAPPKLSDLAPGHCTRRSARRMDNKHTDLSPMQDISNRVPIPPAAAYKDDAAVMVVPCLFVS